MKEIEGETGRQIDENEKLVNDRGKYLRRKWIFLRRMNSRRRNGRSRSLTDQPYIQAVHVSAYGRSYEDQRKHI